MRNLSLIVVALVDVVVVLKADLAIKNCQKFTFRGDLKGLTLNEFLVQNNYSKFFIDHLILPMAGAIWSTSLYDILDFPADKFVNFFINHDLMTGLKPAQKWRTIANGSEQYVNKIINNVRIKSKLNAYVIKVERYRNKC